MSEHEKRKFKLMIDGKAFEWDRSSISGSEIKQLASIEASYQLFQELKGDDPDRPIADGTAVNLAESGEERFYSVPPATFG